MHSIKHYSILKINIFASNGSVFILCANIIIVHFNWVIKSLNEVCNVCAYFKLFYSGGLGASEL